MSADGRLVFFSTTEALVPEDTNRAVDVYEYDAPTGTVHLLSTGSDPLDSYFMSSSASGANVFFLTRQQLVGADTDNSYDMYDARIDGGFREPSPPSPPCSGDTCQGQETAAPSAASPASASVTGSTKKGKAVKPKRHTIRCKKGYVRKKVRKKTKCVRKRKRHKATKSNGARMQRGAR
jgi:hypothetical protein